MKEKTKIKIVESLIGFVCKLIKLSNYKKKFSFLSYDNSFLEDGLINLDFNYTTDRAVMRIALQDMVDNGWYSNIEEAYTACYNRLDVLDYANRRYGLQHGLQNLRSISFQVNKNVTMYKKYLNKGE